MILFLTLGLSLGRHVDGLVDSYYGPPDLANAVAAAPLTPPSELVTEADALVADLASSTDLDPQRRLWLADQVQGLRTYAGVIDGEALSYSDEIGYRKPDPEIFRRTLAGLGAEARHAAHVGDNPIADVTGAQGVGMRGVHLAAGGQAPAGHADVVVTDLRHLVDRLLA